MSKWLVRVCPLLALVALMGNSANVRGDDDEVAQESQVIVVTAGEGEAEATAETDVKVEAGGGKKTVHVKAVVIGDPMKDVDKALQEAGLEGETLKKVREAVQKALKSVKVES
ncbi:MAG: hypothetical protein FJ276_37250, partial [Planctomycetes bacterium]|nr:hypothetical protein [Planctomycetota bacterium]